MKERVQIKENAPVQINIEMPEFVPVTERGPSAGISLTHDRVLDFPPSPATILMVNATMIVL